MRASIDEACVLERRLDEPAVEEHELQVDTLAEQLAPLHALLADVEGDERHAAGLQHAEELAEREDQLQGSRWTMA